jgi:hypothetical protein
MQEKHQERQMQHREIVRSNRCIKINIQINKYKLCYITWNVWKKIATK